MWIFVSKLLSGLLSLAGIAANQIKAAWIQTRALIFALGAFALKQWSARVAWRVAMAAIFVGLMASATSALLSYAVPSLDGILEMFAPGDITANHEGIYHVFWDVGLNLKYLCSVLRRVVSALVTAWSCRKLWALFLVRRLTNPPM